MKDKIAQLLIEIGLDSKDAEQAAARLVKKLEEVGEAGKKSGKGIDQGEKALERWTKAAEIAEKASRILITGMIGIGTVVLGLGHKVLETGATFESLRASLKTVTGSAGAAEDALAFIRSFTAKTPFQLEEVSKAFIKLKAYGLDPSEKALTSYGDTASAMSKSLDDMIEAVADATTGEFERLKEFGIKASKSGEVITFSFKGVRTEVANNAKAIQDYLVGLGETNFAGAMADQSVTLGGLISNLKDSLTEFFLSVAELGPLEEFKGLIEDLKTASGDKGGLAQVLARTLVSAIKTVRRLISGDLIGILEKAAETIEFVVKNFDIFIGLLGAAKTVQAFSAVSTGLRAMGVAATGALGPIGLIMAALIALIPIALKAGSAIGDAMAAHKDPEGTRATKRGGAEFLGDVAEFAPEAAADIAAQNEKVAATMRALEKAKAKDEDPRTAAMFGRDPKSLAAKLRKEEAELARLQTEGRSKKEAGERAAREKAAAEAKAAADEIAEFGDFDADVTSIAQELGIDNFDPQSSDTMDLDISEKKRAQLDAAIAELAVSGDTKKARKAAGLDKKGGRGGKKDKAKKVTSPTTVSEFFAAAAHGDLGPIAAKTPSTKEIEPTVAVDITNNSYKFEVTIPISGAQDPAGIADQVNDKLEKFWRMKLGQAGQSTQTNMKR